MLQPLLDHISKHITLTAEEVEYLGSVVVYKKLRRRQYLLQEGDVSRFETFVVKGCLRTYELDEKGQEHVVLFAIEDWWAGDMYSFLTGTPSRLNVECMEDCELVQISKDALEELYIKVPKFERFFRKLVQNAYVAVGQRLLSAMTRPAQERYLAFIEKYPHIERRVPNRYIASFLGITPESLSRIRRRQAGKKS